MKNFYISKCAKKWKDKSQTRRWMSKKEFCQRTSFYLELPVFPVSPAYRPTQQSCESILSEVGHEENSFRNSNCKGPKEGTAVYQEQKGDMWWRAVKEAGNVVWDESEAASGAEQVDSCGHREEFGFYGRCSLCWGQGTAEERWRLVRRPDERLT